MVKVTVEQDGRVWSRECECALVATVGEDGYEGAIKGDARDSDIALAIAALGYALVDAMDGRDLELEVSDGE